MGVSFRTTYAMRNTNPNSPQKIHVNELYLFHENSSITFAPVYVSIKTTLKIFYDSISVFLVT